MSGGLLTWADLTPAEQKWLRMVYVMARLASPKTAAENSDECACDVCAWPISQTNEE